MDTAKVAVVDFPSFSLVACRVHIIVEGLAVVVDSVVVADLVAVGLADLAVADSVEVEPAEAGSRGYPTFKHISVVESVVF